MRTRSSAHIFCKMSRAQLVTHTVTIAADRRWVAARSQTRRLPSTGRNVAGGAATTTIATSDPRHSLGHGRVFLRCVVSFTQRDGDITASSRDVPIHGRPNLDAPSLDTPNHDTRGANPTDTDRNKGRSRDSRHKPLEDNNRRTVAVVAGQEGQHSVAGLHTEAVRLGQRQPQEWRPTATQSAARLMTSRRILRAWNRLRWPQFADASRIAPSLSHQHRGLRCKSSMKMRSFCATAAE